MTDNCLFYILPQSLESSLIATTQLKPRFYNYWIYKFWGNTVFRTRLVTDLIEGIVKYTLVILIEIGQWVSLPAIWWTQQTAPVGPGTHQRR